MGRFQFAVRKLLYGVPLIVGVTLISFLLMVYFGPDKTYTLIGKNPTVEQIANVRHQLGYDRSFLSRYVEYVIQTLTFDFGHSDSSGEKVMSLLRKTVPVSLALAAPGFILGNLTAIALALWAAYHRGRWLDRVIMAFSVVGMSISYVMVIIGFQFIFCSSFGLDLFPVTGWEASDFGSYLHYVTVPTLCIEFVALGYNTRFYRAVFVEELTRDHVRTARAFGIGPVKLLFKNVLKNSLIPVLSRTIATLPYIVIGGNLLIESYFAIPGVGFITYGAITTGDLPVLKAVVSLTAILYVICLTLTDVVYQIVDPRVG